MTAGPPSHPDWKRELAALVGKRITVVGIGRPHAGDDGVGPLVITLLRLRTSLTLIDAQAVPENFVGPITRSHPDVILLVDAVGFHAPVGSIRLLQGADLDETDFTTHAMSPRLVLDFLARGTAARTLALAVQPGRSGPDAPMSDPVRDAAHAIADHLAGLFPA